MFPGTAMNNQETTCIEFSAHFPSLNYACKTTFTYHLPLAQASYFLGSRMVVLRSFLCIPNWGLHLLPAPAKGKVLSKRKKSLPNVLFYDRMRERESKRLLNFLKREIWTFQSEMTSADFP